MKKAVILAQKAGDGTATTISGTGGEVMQMLASINAAVATTMLEAGASQEQITRKLRELSELGAGYAFEARKGGN